MRLDCNTAKQDLLLSFPLSLQDIKEHGASTSPISLPATSTSRFSTCQYSSSVGGLRYDCNKPPAETNLPTIRLFPASTLAWPIPYYFWGLSSLIRSLPFVFEYLTDSHLLSRSSTKPRMTTPRIFGGRFGGAMSVCPRQRKWLLTVTVLGWRSGGKLLVGFRPGLFCGYSRHQASLRNPPTQRSHRSQAIV